MACEPPNKIVVKLTVLDEVEAQWFDEEKKDKNKTEDANKAKETEKKRNYNVKKEYSFTLIRGGKIHGYGSLKDVKWYNYSIETEDGFQLGYDCIAASLTGIDKGILEKAKDHIFQTGVSTGKRPNIDANSGNIHGPKTEGPDGPICQLVLCNGRGPLTCTFAESDDYYFYTGVHKACYFPPIEEKDKSSFENDIRRRLLKAVWEALRGDGMAEGARSDPYGGDGGFAP